MMLRTIGLMVLSSLACTGTGSLVYDVDVGRAIELGYAPANGSESEQVAALAATVAEALRARGSASAVSVDEGGRLRVALAADEDATRAAADRYCARLGRVLFRIVATDEDLDLATERAKLESWRSMNPGTDVRAFNRIPSDAGGADPRIVWFLPESEDREAAAPIACLRPRSAAQDFGAQDFVEVNLTSDDRGLPALGFALAQERQPAFRAFTGEHAERQLAFVVEGRIVSMPRIDGALPGRGIIRASSASKDALKRAS